MSFDFGPVFWYLLVVCAVAVPWRLLRSRHSWPLRVLVVAVVAMLTIGIVSGVVLDNALLFQEMDSAGFHFE